MGKDDALFAKYHSYQVIGASNIPKTGGVVLAATHSLASYDLFIAALVSREVLGRRLYIVGDDLMFKIAPVGAALKEIGFIGGGREQVVQRLKDGDMLGIAPGGMKESLRSSREKYQFDWSRRMGFAAVAMQAGVPVIPGVGPNADDIFTVYDNPVTPWIYRKFKVPVPIFRGIGPTPLPRPIKLVHYAGKPLIPMSHPIKSRMPTSNDSTSALSRQFKP